MIKLIQLNNVQGILNMNRKPGNIHMAIDCAQNVREQKDLYNLNGLLMND